VTWGQRTPSAPERGEGIPARRNQRGTRPATTTARRSDDGNGNSGGNNRAAYWPVELVVEGQNGDAFRIAVCSRCARILPERETSQRLHTTWDETVLGIDPRTAC
jgi:hypothetical protein